MSRLGACPGYGIESPKATGRGSNSLRGTVMVAAAAMIWGTWSLFLRPAEKLGPISAVTETFMVQVAASLATLPLALPHLQRRKPARAWLLLFCSGLSDTLSQIMFFMAMTLTTLALANLTHYLAPMLVAFAAPWLEKRPRSATTVRACLLACAGLLLMLEPWHDSAGPVMGRIWGPTCGALSAVLFAAHIMLSKHLGRYFNLMENLAYQRLTTVVVLLPFGLTGALHLQAQQSVLLLGGGALITGLAGVLFFAGLAHCRAENASALTLLEPVSAIAVGFVVYRETLSSLGLVGMAMVLWGIYRVIRPARSEVAPAL